MANKDNIKPGTDERDEFNKPKGTGQSGTVGSEGGGMGSNKGMGRPEDIERDRVKDRDLEDERSKEQGQKPGGGTYKENR